MAHWTEKGRARAMLAEALAAEGFKLFGYVPDKSDMMTDYYSPATWHGVAVRSGVVVVCDAPKDMSGKTPKVHGKTAEPGPCSACDGTGKRLHDSTGWTSRDILTGAVHVTPDRKAGDPCEHCQGTGQREEFRLHDGETWPTYTPNPPGVLYHVERHGEIVLRGFKLYHVTRDRFGENGGEGRQALRRIVDLILRAENPGSVRTETPAPVGDVTVRPGKRPGYVEVVFPAKPAASVLDSLKSSGFRWTRYGGCWYGLESRLPAGIGGAA